jgi:molybdopterin-guanine dinucleotide biosynthesis protein A
MGRDKALLPFGGSDTLSQFQIQRLKPLFGHTYLSVKEAGGYAFEADFIEDLALGVYSSACALLSVLTTLQKSVFVLSVDTPFVDENIIKKLFAASDNGSICTLASSCGKLHTLCAIYTPEAISALSLMIQENDHKLQHLIEKIPHKIVDFPTDKPFFNINKPEDYEKAKQGLYSYRHCEPMTAAWQSTLLSFRGEAPRHA